MIALRQGVKTDADVLATLILSSAPVLLPYLFKGQEQAINYIYHASQQPDGQYSAMRHQLAVDGARAIACITLWDDELPSAFHTNTLQSLKQLLQADQLMHLLDTNDIIKQVFLAPLSHQLCIGHLAVLNDYRGLGVGKKLIAHAISQAKMHSKTQLVLDVDSSNDEAVSFYNGLGFILIQSTQFRATKQVFYRMQFTL